MDKHTNTVDQRGVVSFMVTLIMMLVISLIVIGFTQVTIRSRREALDKQLSSQAFYAAESGINKAINKINQNLSSVAEKNTCNNDPIDTYNSFELDGTNVEVTCIMVDARPSNIVGKATQNSSYITYINPVDAGGASSDLSELTFTWLPPDGEDGAGNSCTDAEAAFISKYDQCKFGILRVDMLPVSGAGVYDFNRTMTFYMKPYSNAASPPARDVSGYTIGQVVRAHCSTEKCSAKLSGVGSGKFYVRMSTMYRDSKSVSITGKLAVTNVDAYFQDAQAVIDATGRAQDVLRRVQVRYSLGRGDDTPPWAAAGGVCKRLTVVAGTVSTDSMCL